MTVVFDTNVFISAIFFGGTAQAEIIVSGDNDLLSLGKPFGIEILGPREFLKRFSEND